MNIINTRYNKEGGQRGDHSGAEEASSPKEVES